MTNFPGVLFYCRCTAALYTCVCVKLTFSDLTFYFSHCHLVAKSRLTNVNSVVETVSHSNGAKISVNITVLQSHAVSLLNNVTILGDIEYSVQYNSDCKSFKN